MAEALYAPEGEAQQLTIGTTSNSVEIVIDREKYDSIYMFCLSADWRYRIKNTGSAAVATDPILAAGKARIVPIRTGTHLYGIAENGTGHTVEFYPVRGETA
jgi:hypothetical protein